MFGIYASPTNTFQRLKEKPVWLLPLIIALVANMAVTVLSTQYVDWGKQHEQAIEKMQEKGMTEEQIQKATERMEQFSSNPFMRTGLPLIGSLITQVIVVFFLAFVYNISLPLLGVTGNFMRTLSVVTNAGLIALPAALVKAIIIIIKHSAEVSTSLLLAAPNIKTGFLAVLLRRIDIFTIWQLILVGLGLKVVFDIKGSKPYWIVFGVWALVTVIFGLLATPGQ
ncbi:hypothetical protein CH330_06220 [candidate division WOR-3 bacterium JGI_Cruoil_03_51_56]|uniref:Yip1 domain-containing protein n=1 Tax=candidate division WOR-3 bacterium JGI_Cruoil_03_51_56 TaxID=1973747 RepID=A0A235BSJ2_UNCW3|nr:MAG: hypothetical protein CH330_06220 [candidate division WOR-3 bacterium JGI_Cruoil_03_51_56]